MFHKAVDAHKKGPSTQQRTSNIFSSSPQERQQQQSIQQTVQKASQVNMGLGQTILRPSVPSQLNGSTHHSDRGSNVGIKRTSSGVAKALSGNLGGFEDGRGSQRNAIVTDENSPIKCAAPKVTSCEYFNEDDFDDDIDLDIEDPSCKATITYPALPTLTKEPTTSVIDTTPTVVPGMFYPTLPKQSSKRSDDSMSRCDSGHASVESAALRHVGSSAPLPWSSSPPEHLTAQPQALSLKDSSLNNGITPARRTTVSNTAKLPPVPKRNKLPWVKAESQIDQNGPPPVSESETGSRNRMAHNTTPADKHKYPWNTTTSAMKEAREKFKEENRKKIKVDESRIEPALKNAKKSNSVARVFLSEEQQHVLDLVSEQKKSVFFTGSAGTGKSVLLREIIATLRKKYVREPDRVAVTASTGLAACNVGGVTLHSFAGIGLGKEPVPELVKKIKRNAKAKIRWTRTKVLIVDEISMVDGELFDKLEAIARQMRKNGRPFGGIQLVITGDFFQLPPVPDSGKVAKFAFDATTWNTSIEHTIGLHHVFRQKDPVFAGMLNEMREGRLTPSSIKAFSQLSRPIEYEDSIDSTELFPTRNEVERANGSKMSQLVGEVQTYEARDGGAITDKVMRDKLLQNCMAPETIHLKKGAQVMLIKNIDETLVNGSLGQVIGFMSETQFDNYTANQLTNQGANDLREAADSIADQKSRAQKRLQDNLFGSTSQIYPLVRFTISDNTSRDLLCQPELWKIELPDGEVQASRLQIPLILAWALSIHKAQGQTLNRVKVDLGKVFEKGQAYVALSRATSMQGLQVLRFDARKVVAHDKVRAFYSNLSRVEEIERKSGSKAGSKGNKAGSATSRENGIGADEYQKKFIAGKF
ncbi:hypothetical protein AAFC00_006271 [Neodothiora populina]|uniref:ATP-dependent DNA helicase PIF1 n=1 Tax=Neodothiora populina TaxID=2781224 RepID=A0ABR3P4W3_9PEZI